MNKRKTAASQTRLGIENIVAQGRYNAPVTAQSEAGSSKIDQQEKLMSMVKQSPYSNALSHANLAVAGGFVIGNEGSPNNRDLHPSMSVDKRLNQI